VRQAAVDVLHRVRSADAAFDLIEALVQPAPRA
jgi:hypothetical protein